jgi:hypothetical protein
MDRRLGWVKAECCAAKDHRVHNVGINMQLGYVSTTLCQGTAGLFENKLQHSTTLKSLSQFQILYSLGQQLVSPVRKQSQNIISICLLSPKQDTAFYVSLCISNVTYI